MYVQNGFQGTVDPSPQQPYSTPMQPHPTQLMQNQNPAPYYTNQPYHNPHVGSLGTPCFGSFRTNSSMGTNSHTSLRSTPYNSAASQNGLLSSNSSSTNVANPNVKLVPTRPLLKALAKISKPNPPWCVGMPSNCGLDDELRIFLEFHNPTHEEISVLDELTKTALRLLKQLWPEVLLVPVGVTAVGMPVTRERTAHYVALKAVTDADSAEARLQKLASAAGVQLQFFTDYRSHRCVTFTDGRSGIRANIRYGDSLATAQRASAVFQNGLANSQSAVQVLQVLLTLLQQNRLLDETGNHPELISSESVAVMLLSVVNSYGPNDQPNAGRLLNDFFLSFGFPAYFNAATSSVNYKGAVPPTPKVHTDASLSVLDPGDPTQNLSTAVEKTPALQAVFHYCFTAISQYEQVGTKQRRAQSALSTIIGGEPYWTRVLKLYEDGVEPYAQQVSSKKAHLLRSI